MGEINPKLGLICLGSQDSLAERPPANKGTDQIKFCSHFSFLQSLHSALDLLLRR